jgi:hypothetical protein
MRTTISLDADAAALVRRAMADRGIGFKQAVNDAIRAGLGGVAGDEDDDVVMTARMGVPSVNLDRALELAGSLEDEELLRRMRVGK